MFAPDPTRRVTNIKWGGIWVLSIGVNAICRSQNGVTVDASVSLTIGELPPRLVLRATIDSGTGPGRTAHGDNLADHFERLDLLNGPLTIIDTRVETEMTQVPPIEPTGWTIYRTSTSTLVLPTKDNGLLSHNVPISCVMETRGIRVAEDGSTTRFFIVGSSANGEVDHYLIKAKNFDALPFDDPSDPAYDPKAPHQSSKSFSVFCTGEGWDLGPGPAGDGQPPHPVLMSASATDKDEWIIDTIDHKIISHNGIDVPQNP